MRSEWLRDAMASSFGRHALPEMGDAGAQVLARVGGIGDLLQ
jgi:hypothetical protein